MPPDPAGSQTSVLQKHYVLSIDLGSSGCKVALVSDTGRVTASAVATVITHLLPGGGAEQDAEAWWSGAVSAAKKVIEQAGVPPEMIVAVCCDSQWSVAVPVDDNCRPLMRAIHWLDSRGAPYNRRIVAGFPSVQGYGVRKLVSWIRATGLAPTQSGVDSLGHVLFIKNERPEIYARTRKFLEPMDYLTARLTGRITATQKTMVPFVIVDNREWGSRAYSEPLLRLAGLDPEKFPELIANDGIVGPLDPSVASDLGLRPSTQVIAGATDTSVSAIGSGAVSDFDAIIYIGTSLYMTCHIPFKKTDILHMMTSLPSPFPGRYLLFGEQGAGGRCVEFYLNGLVYPEDRFDTGPAPSDAYNRFNDIAADAPPGSDGVIFLPWLNGSIVPCEDPHMRGGFMNLSLRTTRAHMSRAVMEGIAFNSRWTMGPAQKFLGRPIQHFRFSGGGALSDLWAQIHADILGVPVHQVDDPVNATVRGSALLALVSLGYKSVDALSDLVAIRRMFEPDDKNRTVYDRMYAQYRALFQKNRKIFAALNP